MAEEWPKSDSVGVSPKATQKRQESDCVTLFCHLHESDKLLAQGILTLANLSTPPFCWTKCPKKDMKIGTKFPKHFAEIRPECLVLSWQVEKSDPKISPDISHEISNAKSNFTENLTMHFCRHGNPKILLEILWTKCRHNATNKKKNLSPSNLWSELKHTCTYTRYLVDNCIQLQTLNLSVLFQRTPWGGWKKEGGGKPHEWHPSQKGVLDPPRTVRFPPPSGVSALFLLYKNPRQSRPEALLEGSKNFLGRAFSGTFSSPHTFCTPPISRPNFSSENPWRP